MTKSIVDRSAQRCIVILVHLPSEKIYITLEPSFQIYRVCQDNFISVHKALSVLHNRDSVVLFICPSIYTPREEKPCVDLNNAAVEQHLFGFPVLSVLAKKPKLNTLNNHEKSEPC